MGNPRRSNGSLRSRLIDEVISDEDACWLCGAPVDKRLRNVKVINPKTGRFTLHPDAPVVDEVLPVALGGSPLLRDNLRLAHNSCNAYRGKRMDIEAVRQELRVRRQEARKAKPRPSQSW